MANTFVTKAKAANVSPKIMAICEFFDRDYDGMATNLDYEFDYPDYGGIPYKFNRTFTPQQVDFIQDLIRYFAYSREKQSSYAKRKAKDCIFDQLQAAWPGKF